MSPTTLPQIAGLRADIVPHRRWPISKWFYANPLWYYHRPGNNDSERIAADRKFYELVDPELREVCQLLNDAELHTTPSCQGHFYPRERFERIWDELTCEAAEVCADGLVVKDSQTDAEYLFHQPDYVLPWPSFDAFFREAGAHQGAGYLGFIVPPDRRDLLDRFASISCTSGDGCIKLDRQLSEYFDGWLFDITTHPSDPADRAAKWRRLTDLVRQVLRRPAS